MAEKEDVEVLVRNRRARHDYHVESTIEAGIELRGSEVKSLRAAEASMSDAYAEVVDGQMYLRQLQINEYKWANRFGHELKRDRRLLLHKREILKLGQATKEQGYTLIPLELYLKKGRIKVLLGLCRGKKVHDKRESERAKDAERDIARALGRRR